MGPDVKKGHIAIQNVSPQVDGGRRRAKAVVGDTVHIEADILRDGPDVLGAVIRYKSAGDARWNESPLLEGLNDRWSGHFQPTAVGVCRYTIEAWTDRFATWRRDLSKKVEAGQDVGVELEEGAILLEAHVRAVPRDQRKAVLEVVEMLRKRPAKGGRGGFEDPRVEVALDPAIAALMHRHHDRSGRSTYKPALELRVDRPRARFGAWYEFFPRSTGTAKKHGTFASSKKLLPVIADLGFDIVYLPPVHPIGDSARKGKNNALTAESGDVGVPWAIGSKDGGHKAIHPELGTIDDFDDFVAAAEKLGMEVCIDFAIQCSPDHPWVTEHPEWFHHRPDGSIKYAENPPKKYQDVYPINFDTDNAAELWLELKSVIDHWIAHGVKIFRVDNPHTKPFPFWEWLIEETHSEHPEVIFLAEAFTRPKVMRELAKLGFTQSYTYFTWKNTKWELEEYLTELTQTEMVHYFRPNFFTNTPDILHEYLQTGGPPAFKVRLVLAALLAPSYGIYSGFEFFENTPREQGSEEYLDSEKYELRPRDYSKRKGTLMPYIKRINEIRGKYPVLSRHDNLRFHPVDKDNLMAFSKAAPGQDPILVVVNLNPFHWEEGTVSLDLGAMGIDPFRPFEVQDLISGASFMWHGPHSYVRLDPADEPAHVFVVRR